MTISRIPMTISRIPVTINRMATAAGRRYLILFMSGEAVG